MKKGFEIFVAVVSFLAMASAECPNACSAHGKCGAYDMCTCYRNWMSNDCSERICQFGLAHVDTPKGDLDSSSGALSGPGVTVVTNNDVYPCGTTEQYPTATDSNGNVLTNYAHEYRECSNKGICDRSSGTCQCFDGYDGTACQRASCPSSNGQQCSGHGACHTVKELAELDFDNIYNLWDEHSTMGCLCDGGWTGADCSEKVCKSGADPLYFDEVSTARYSNYTYQFYTTTTKQGVSGTTLTGNYSLIFTDSKSKEWTTGPISWNATCDELTDIIEAIPNKVIPANSVRCFKSEIGNQYGQDMGSGSSCGTGNDPSTTSSEPICDTTLFIHSKYTIAFSGNPGRLPQIKINMYLDGSRPTLYSSETASTLGYHVYPNGFIGEDVDMVNDYCEGVTVNLNKPESTLVGTHFLSGLTTATAKLLKKCLGDSDGDSSNNVEVYNWDYGTQLNPHLIKLVDATQYYPNYVANIDETSCDNDCQMDVILKKFPSSPLCTSQAGNKVKFGQDFWGTGYCSNLNPAGFFAALVYDPNSVFGSSAAGDNPFRLYTRAAWDYASTTSFFVFTTKGYLNVVNVNSGVVTTKATYSVNENAASHYTRSLELYNATTRFPGYLGQLDCETNRVGLNGARDCLNKNDWVMILATDGSLVSNPTSLAANPVYPNLYQVKKIFRSDKVEGSNTATTNSETVRHQLHLDYGMNAKYSYTGGNKTTTADTSAYVFKFHPSTENSNGGYKYVGECSERGICNTQTGICECFHGYTSDNCGTINALAQ